MTDDGTEAEPEPNDIDSYNQDERGDEPNDIDSEEQAERELKKCYGKYRFRSYKNMYYIKRHMYVVQYT